MPHRRRFAVELAAAEQLADRPATRLASRRARPRAGIRRFPIVPTDAWTRPVRRSQVCHSPICRKSDRGVRPFIDRLGCGGSTDISPSSTRSFRGANLCSCKYSTIGLMCIELELRVVHEEVDHGPPEVFVLERSAQPRGHDRSGQFFRAPQAADLPPA